MVKAYKLGNCEYCPHKNEEPFPTLQAIGANPKLMEMHCRMEAPDAAAEVGNTNGLAVLNGAVTPIHIFVISSSANDDGAPVGTGMLTVSIFGIDGDDQYVVDTIILNGTTQVEGAVLFKRVITAWGATFGTGLVAAGNIKISNTGQTADYLYIAAGSNRSNRIRFWVPTGYSAQLMRIYASFYQAEAAAALALAGGTNIWSIRQGSDKVPEQREDIANHTVVPIAAAAIHPNHLKVVGSDDSFIALYHSTVNTEANSSHDVMALFIVWQDPTTAGVHLA